MPLRWRVALFGSAVVLLTVLLFGVVLYGLVARGLTRQQDDALRIRARQAATQLEQAPGVALNGPPAPVTLDLASGAETFLELLDRSGIPLWSSGTIDGAPPAIPRELLAGAGASDRAVTTLPPQEGTGGQHGVTLRVFVQPWRRVATGAGGYVVAGQPERGLRSALSGLRGFLFISAILSLIAALGALWFVLERALRPLRRIAHAVDAIDGASDLDRRLPAVVTSDEIGMLTRSFNGMLQRVQAAHERLAAALDAQQRFVADASHELRTPLTTIRNSAGFLLQHVDAGVADRRAALEDIAVESDRMTRLVRDLLTLARAGSGRPLERLPVDLGEIVRDVARKARTLHPDRTIESEGEESMIVPGNGDALTRLLWIVVDNAVRFTEPGGHIVIALDRAKDGASLRVSDDGSGVPPAERQRIFERFYQADSSRSGEGSGLGLAIARRIVEQHGGSIGVAEGSAPGATFRIELPALSDAAQEPSASPTMR